MSACLGWLAGPGTQAFFKARAHLALLCFIFPLFFLSILLFFSFDFFLISSSNTEFVLIFSLSISTFG
jgi:hypothetical protein